MATSQENPGPPEIPERHPGRLSRVKTNASMKPTGLPSEYLDIWEHASVLYHGFEWQSAADTFLILSQQIEREIESTLCLLNAAIIFARLDDFAIASKVLKGSQPAGDLLPLAMFVLGHVEFEQGNYDKSQHSFQIALANLNAPCQCYDRYGLDFTLRASHIQQNLRIFETKSNLFGILGSIGALPADGIFEAPSRPYARYMVTPVMSRTSSNSDDLPTLSEGSSSSSVTASPIEKRGEEESSDMWWFANREDTTEPYSNQFDFDFDLANGNSEYKAAAQPILPGSDPRVVGGLVRSLAQPQTPVIAPPRRSHRRALIPREARIQGNSTSPLANFIRQLPSQTALEARCPILESAHTGDLAEFLRTSSPQCLLPRGRTSHQSASTGSLKAESIKSLDLLAEEDLVRPSQAADTPDRPPKHPKHPYRSGVGSILLHENSQSTASSRHSRSKTRRNISFESTRMNTDSLHSFLCHPTSDKQSTRSYAFTDEHSNDSRSIYSQGSNSRSRTESPLSRPVSMTAVHPALRPDIPSRTSSLRRHSPSQLTRSVEAWPGNPPNFTIPSTSYSELKPTRKGPREEAGHTGFL